MVVTFFCHETADGEQTNWPGDGVPFGFWGKSIETASGEENICRSAAAAFAQVGETCVRGRVDEAGGAQLRFEERVAAVTINVIGVSSEGERDIAQPSQNRRGSGRPRGPHTMDYIGFVPAEVVGAADGENGGPDGGPKVFGVGGAVLAIEAPAVANQCAVAE